MEENRLIFTESCPGEILTPHNLPRRHFYFHFSGKKCIQSWVKLSESWGTNRKSWHSRLGLPERRTFNIPLHLSCLSLVILIAKSPQYNSSWALMSFKLHTIPHSRPGSWAGAHNLLFLNCTPVFWDTLNTILSFLPILRESGSRAALKEAAKLLKTLGTEHTEQGLGVGPLQWETC